MNRSRWLELSVDEVPDNRLTFERVFKGCFGFHERVECVLEPRILLTILSKRCQVSFQAGFFFTPPAEVTRDGLIQKLIDGTPFDLTQVLECCALISVNSQRESDSSHVATSLGLAGSGVNVRFRHHETLARRTQSGTGLAQHFVNGTHQFHRLNGLGQVSLKTTGEQSFGIFRPDIGSQCNGRRLAAVLFGQGSDSRYETQTVFAGHSDVGDHDVRTELAEQFEPLGRAARRIDTRSRFSQHEFENAQCRRVIVNDED